MEATLEMRTEALLDFLQGLRGTLHAALEERTYAEWLYELLSPPVAEGLVCDARQLPRHRGEKKSDKMDARKPAEWLRTGSLGTNSSSSGSRTRIKNQIAH